MWCYLWLKEIFQENVLKVIICEFKVIHFLCQCHAFIALWTYNSVKIEHAMWNYESFHDGQMDSLLVAVS